MRLRRLSILPLALAALAFAGPDGAAMAQAPQKPATVEDARAFLADAEEKLLDLWIEREPRVLGAVDLHHRRHRDALGAGQREADRRDGGARRRRRRASTAWRFRRDVARKIDAAQARAHARRAANDPTKRAELTRIAAELEGDVRQGQVLPEADRQECLDIERRSRRSWPRAAIPRSCSTSGRAGTRSRRRCATHVRALRRARQRGRAGARLRRHRRDVALEVRHAARRVRRGARPAVGPGEAALRCRCTAYVRAQARARSTATTSCRADGPIPAHLLGNMWAQEWGNIYDLVAPRRTRDPGYDLTELLKRARTSTPIEMVQLRRGLLHLARLRAAAGDLLGALAVRQAARPRGRLPRQRLGHRHDGRPAHQDVHRDQRRGLRHHPPRARPQLLPARLQHAAVPVPRQRQRRLPRGASATPSRCRSRRSTCVKLGLHRQGAATRRSDIGAAAAAGARQGRVPAVRPADRPVALEGVLAARSRRTSYNQAWWELRAKYQGVAPPVAAQRSGLRSGRQVPRAGATCRTRATSWPTSCSSSSTARCAQAAGCSGPLHRCSIYGSKEAGAQLNDDAGDGRERALARRARGAHRRAARWTRPRSSTTSRR